MASLKIILLLLLLKYFDEMCNKVERFGLLLVGGGGVCTCKYTYSRVLVMSLVVSTCTCNSSPLDFKEGQHGSGSHIKILVITLLDPSIMFLWIL